MSVPPGASYRVSNAMIIAKRHLLNLEHPVRIEFDSSGKMGPELLDWHVRHDGQFIDTVQLRKECESPFFHEYIVFSLRQGGGYFRVDRRQRPDEATPLNSMRENGVEAHDTMEEVTSFDDALYCQSNCLIEIKFNANIKVGVGLLLDICKAIYAHPSARVYTLQRYNCYFFAQTIALCITLRALESSTGQQGNYDQPATNSKGSGCPCAYSSSTWSRTASETSSSHSVGQPIFSECTRGIKLPHKVVFRQRSHASDSSETSSASTADSIHIVTTSFSKLTDELCSRRLIARIHQCKSCARLPVLITSKEVPWRISSALDQAHSLLKAFWEALLSSTLQTMAFNPAALGLWDTDVRQYIEQLWKSAALGLVRSQGDDVQIRKLWLEFSGHVLDRFMVTLLGKLLSSNPRSLCPTPPHNWAKDQKISVDVLQNNDVIKEWRALMCRFFDSEYSNLDAIVRKVALQGIGDRGKCAMAERTLQERSIKLKQSIEIRLNNKNARALRSKGAPQPHHPVPIFDRNPMHVSTYGEMQNFIKDDIDAHSIRVEHYKMVLRSTAFEVGRDIKLAMSDIWGTISGANLKHVSMDVSDFGLKIGYLKASSLGIIK